MVARGPESEPRGRSNRVCVALVQSRAGTDKAENVSRTVDKIADAAGRGAQIVCLEELFATPYFCQSEDSKNFDLAEPRDGSTSRAVAEAAKRYGVTVVSSLFEERTRGVYHNTAQVFGPEGEEIALYRKMHIPDDPQFYEKFYFTPGDLGFVVAESPRANVGPLICWDQWFPEAARLTTLLGAELLVYPTAIGWLPEEKQEHGAAQLAAWQTVQRSHAIVNGVFVIAVNRVGFEANPAGDSARDGIEFWGHSFVCSPSGVVIAEAGEGEEILVVDCDLSQIDEARRAWPFLRDRRVDAYFGLEERFIGPR